MSARSWMALALAALLAVPAAAWARPAQQDYLTETEADKIRNAASTNERIGLFLDFAADRLQRFEQELQMKGTGPLRADFLNDLLDSFSACVDEAASRIDGGVNNGEDVRAGIQDARKRIPGFLAELKKIQAKNTNGSLYRDALSDAQSDLQDDLSDVEKDAKQLNFNSPVGKPRGRESH
jgi:hypothetical protein